MIKVHLAEGGAPVGHAGPVIGEQPTRLQRGYRIPVLPLTANGSDVQVIAQIVHTRCTVHHGITVLSQVLRRLRVGVLFAPEVTDVTTVSLGSARPRGLPRVVAGLSIRIVSRPITETLFTDTLTTDDRLRMILLLVLLVLRLLMVATMLTALAVGKAAMRRASIVATWI